MIVESINSLFFKYLKYDPKLGRWYCVLAEKYRKLYNKFKDLCDKDGAANDLKIAFRRECQNFFVPTLAVENKNDKEYRILLSFERWFQKIYRQFLIYQKKKNLKKMLSLPFRTEVSKESWTRIFQLALNHAARGSKSGVSQNELDQSSSIINTCELYPIREFQLSLKYICEPYSLIANCRRRFVSKTERILKYKHCVPPPKKSLKNTADGCENSTQNDKIFNGINKFIEELESENSENFIPLNKLKNYSSIDDVLECIEECNVRSDKISKNVLFNVYERRFKYPELACEFAEINPIVYSDEFSKLIMPEKLVEEIVISETNVESELPSEESKHPECVLNAASIIEALKTKGFELKSYKTNGDIFNAVFECKFLSKILTVDIDMEKSTINILKKHNSEGYTQDFTFEAFLLIINKEIEKAVSKKSMKPILY